MRENDFSLIEQPWIRVRTADATVKEISLLDVFAQAHELQALAGELPTQDVAVLRLLLAVLHTVFSRVDIDGVENPLEETESTTTGIYRWKAIWETQKFPLEPIREYLECVSDRFWLFDETYPFMQFPKVKENYREKTKGGVQCNALKLNGEINQSGNKTRIFLSKNGSEKESLTYSEAARWLIHLISYDDSSVKPSSSCTAKPKAGEKGPGSGWLGKLGVVFAEGENLFETLMLNLVMWPNGGSDIDGASNTHQKPIWESETVPLLEREHIFWPDNMAELLTFPSRYVMLEREHNRVTGYFLVTGPYFDVDNPNEQMTRRIGKTDKNGSAYRPAPHQSETFLWQEFDSLFCEGIEEDDSRPGIVCWINKLQSIEGTLGVHLDETIRFKAVQMFYGDKGSSIGQIERDTLSIHGDLISDLGSEWRNVITSELFFTQKIANLIGWLVSCICTAESGTEEPEPSKREKDMSGPEKRVLQRKKEARAQFYEAMDLPFRYWLQNICINSDPEIKKAEWREQVIQTARNIGKSLVNQAGAAAYTGHYVSTEKNKTPRFYSSAKAYEQFEQRLRKEYRKEGGRK